MRPATKHIRPLEYPCRGTDPSPGPGTANGTPTETGYYATALPVAVGNSGQRGFATAGSGTIYFDGTGVAPTEAQMAAGGGGTPLQ